MKLSITAAIIAAASVSAEVLHLTPENYDEMTAGKTVLLKFYAPWCGHCKKMAPDWEKLFNEWDGNDIGLVAKVDCTAEGKPLCDANGVRGFPTLKWGDANDLQDYSGGRSFNELSKFAKNNLKPICSPANLDLCDDEMKAKIAEYSAMGSDKLDGLIAEGEKKIEDAESNFQKEVEALQKKYEQLKQEQEDAITAVKESGMGLMKSVKASMEKSSGSDEL